ncbi:MAG: amino acid ABC transporter ATP-binding protein [Oscillospiraceae bacterium]|nr:amino acid ABC transporter ATP-binding protein [Oscillospiraceae bacterium]
MSILEVKDLRKTFGKNEILKGISFSLEQGEVLSIIGSSGSGKTTLLRCLNFLEFAESGTISVKGSEIYNGVSTMILSDAQIRERRLHFGLVFQSFNLFPQYNILKNITLAPSLMKRDTPKVIEARAVELIERVGLKDRMYNYPCELSGGQQQRVAIARALALNPDILCFDEPTSALDPELTGEVLKVIRELKSSDCTMIVVTHEMEFAKNVSDKVIFMADGIIEETGTPKQVFEDPQSPKTRSFLSKSLEKYND